MMNFHETLGSQPRKNGITHVRTSQNWVHDNQLHNGSSSRELILRVMLFYRSTMAGVDNWKVCNSSQLCLRCLWLPALHFNGLSRLVTFSRTMVSLHLTRKKHTIPGTRNATSSRKHQWIFPNMMCIKKTATFFNGVFRGIYVTCRGVDRDVPTRKHRILHPFAILAIRKPCRSRRGPR